MMRLLLRFTLISISLLTLMISTLLGFQRFELGETYIYGEVDMAAHQVDLFVLNPDTGSAEFLFSQPQWFSVLAVSHNRRSLYIVDTTIRYSSGIFQLYLKPLTGQEQQELAGDYMYYSHAFSPDGRWMAFANYEYSAAVGFSVFNIYLVREDGEGKRRLVENQDISSLNMIWSPDSRSLIVSGIVNNTENGLWRINVQDDSLEKISDLRYVTLIQTTPTGLLFSARPETGGAGAHYYFYEWESGTVRFLFDEEGRLQHISGAGQSMYFLDSRDPSMRFTRLIEIAPAEGYAIREIYAGEQLGTAPLLFSDEWVLLKDAGIWYRIALDGSYIEPLPDRLEVDLPIYVSPGEWVYYLQTDDPSTRISTLYRMRPDGSQAQRVTVNGGSYDTLLPYTLPHDELRIAYLLAGSVISLLVGCVPPKHLHLGARKTSLKKRKT